MSDWRDSREYRMWKVAVVRRDCRCFLCHSIKDREAHHKNHATFFPEMRFIPENGITLCKPCHSKYHNDFHGSTKMKCTERDWQNFSSLAAYIRGLPA